MSSCTVCRLCPWSVDVARSILSSTHSWRHTEQVDAVNLLYLPHYLRFLFQLP